MMSDHLLRKYAPIPATGWQQIDDEAKDRLTPRLAARRLVDWSGPHGWKHSATTLGRTTSLETAPPGTKFDTVVARQRRVLALSEFRVSFTVECAGLQDAERGATDVDYADLDRATHDAALIENRAVFHGWPEAGITGIVESSSHPSLPLGQEANTYPHAIAKATNLLRQAGIEGPYTLAISPEGYTRISETTESGGYPLREHLTKILGGDIVWAPGLDGALVVSKRGGDFSLDIGQDFSIGYTRHDAELVTLYLEESFSFRVTEPDAAVVLTDG
ncbi:MAG: family 1 encapsulin nanocompartment shell protein [Pseudonocardiaceae bacterium]